MKNLEKYLSVSEEVKQALAEGKPVVALESTIISHGMPYPKNVETALNVEKIVRENGAVPATIAIIKGKITVGLSKEEIEYLGKEGLAVTKASRRDLPVLCALGANGATTVATTMIGAALAGVIIGVGLYKKKVTYWRVFIVRLINSIVINVILGTYWLDVMYGKGFIALLPTRLFKNVIMVPIETFIFLAIYKAIEKGGIIQMLRQPVGHKK